MDRSSCNSWLCDIDTQRICPPSGKVSHWCNHLLSPPSTCNKGWSLYKLTGITVYIKSHHQESKMYSLQYNHAPQCLVHVTGIALWSFEYSHFTEYFWTWMKEMVVMQTDIHSNRHVKPISEIVLVTKTRWNQYIRTLCEWGSILE